jgi:catechol 2,3-dioxygenase
MNFIVSPEQLELANSLTIAAGERIGHVNLRVADLDRATSFYCDVLNLKVVYYGPSIGIPTVFLAFGDYHHHIALNWFCSDGGPRHGLNSGLNHFAIVYPSEPALAKAVAHILQRGDLVDDARDHGATLSVYLRDPDSNGIELYYDRPRTHWFDSTGEFVKSEPFDVLKWLEESSVGLLRSSVKRPLVSSQEVTQ